MGGRDVSLRCLRCDPDWRLRRWRGEVETDVDWANSENMPIASPIGSEKLFLRAIVSEFLGVVQPLRRPLWVVWGRRNCLEPFSCRCGEDLARLRWSNLNGATIVLMGAELPSSTSIAVGGGLRGLRDPWDPCVSPQGRAENAKGDWFSVTLMTSTAA